VQVKIAGRFFVPDSESESCPGVGRHNVVR
jgi:hypothetical protein